MLKNIVIVHTKSGNTVTLERRLLNSWLKVNTNETVVNIDYGFSISEKEYSDMKRDSEQAFDRLFGDLFKSINDLNK